MVQLLTVTCLLLILSNKGKGMQSSSEQPLVREGHYVTTLITAAKETISGSDPGFYLGDGAPQRNGVTNWYE